LNTRRSFFLFIKTPEGFFVFYTSKNVMFGNKPFYDNLRVRK
jgi:hypothetical protein